MITITGDASKVIKDLNQQQRKVVKPSVTAALNQTGSMVQTAWRRKVAGDLGIPQKHLKGKLKLFRATFRKGNAKIWLGKQQSIPVSKVLKSKSKQRRYMKEHHPVEADRIFWAKMPSGHEGVFFRKGKKRLPIQEGYIDFTRISNTALHFLGRSISDKVFSGKLTHELKRRLARLKTR